MAYIRKNVNIFLLFVIVITVVAIAGLTTYYQSTYKNLSTSYDTKLAEIEKLIGDLNLQRTKLNQTTYELNIKEEREEELSGQYTTVKKDLQTTQSELDATKTVLESTKNELASTTASLADAQAEIVKNIATIGSLQSQIRNLQGDLEDCEGTLSTCTCP